MKKSNVATRNYNAVEINHVGKIIAASQAFLDKASKMGTKEYKTLVEIMNAHPTYQIEVKVNEKKKTYKNYNIASFKEIIMAQPNAEKMMAEFEEVLKVGKSVHAMYPRAKQWMFENYKDVIKNQSAATATDTATADTATESEAVA